MLCFRASIAAQFGGWYFDLDFVFVRALSDLSSADVVLASTTIPGLSTHSRLSNCAMKFKTPKHPLLEKYLNAFASGFKVCVCSDVDDDDRP